MRVLLFLPSIARNVPRRVHHQHETTRAKTPLAGAVVGPWPVAGSDCVWMLIGGPAADGWVIIGTAASSSGDP